MYRFVFENIHFNKVRNRMVENEEKKSVFEHVPWCDALCEFEREEYICG